MATLELVGVPESLIERLTALAVENNRSLSEEAVAALEQWVETTALISRLREHRAKLHVPPLTDAQLRRMKNDGRR
ncbi:MAG: hypothetical protein IPO52_01810 [Gemmatimonadetes bacterium]|jgi:hypothetical protein|nr:hypothetical protein [Gemmatimonadota bacterium]MBK9547857.1 hypothetical protein [Gemmatimonadota bacterium]MBP6443333.1 hypothetical protein [Gemmatimonadales bacterium]MBP6570516.1 hypothetical protein [Gemmatimonadales bacterium]MBP7620096.1 hypothetical protein [Gemmatimonadales bacterium]